MSDIPEYKYKSRFERRFAADLKQRRIVFDYEKHKFSYQPKIKTYTPDFYMPEFDLFVETKGFFNVADRVKHLLIKEQHPDVDIRFIFMNPFTKINRKSSTTYASWCEEHGFQFAEERIPKEWIKASSRKKLKT
jgi:hypothetical protein|tara:strand:- start:417 stop:818 length:402 start_codon:yes stop_codon:yes gene_type:complete